MLMRWKLMSIMMLIVAFGAVGNAQVEIEDYNMIFTLSETSADAYMEIFLGNSSLSSMSFSTDDFEKFSAHDSSGPLEYQIDASENGETTQVFLRGDDRLYLEFSSKKFVFTSGDIKQFFADVSLGFETRQMDVTVKLPVGYITDSHFPRDAEISSDGSRIILSWSFGNPASSIISVRFRKSENLSVIPFIITGIIGIIAAGSVYYYRKRSHKEFLEGFSDDEVKVIEFMKKAKRSYQNIIEKEFHFSRAKMTRIVYRLEEKGLLEKKKKGRTNRLMWVKGNRNTVKIDKSKENQEKTEQKKISKLSKAKKEKTLNPKEEQVVKDMFG